MFLYQTNSIVEIIDFPLIEQLNDLNRHYHTWPRGGMVTQRIANPCIPVRFWAWPPKNWLFYFFKKSMLPFIPR
jgi:hypothetical protein